MSPRRLGMVLPTPQEDVLSAKGDCISGPVPGREWTALWPEVGFQGLWLCHLAEGCAWASPGHR